MKSKLKGEVVILKQPSVAVCSLELSDYDNRLANEVAKMISEGWELMCQPTYCGHRTPWGANYAVVGPRAHFLFLFQKRPV